MYILLGSFKTGKDPKIVAQFIADLRCETARLKLMIMGIKRAGIMML